MTVIGAQIGYRAFVRQPFWLEAPTAAIFAAMLFNLALCFLNTNIGGVGNSAVISCEVVIILAVLLYVFPAISYPRFLVIGSAIFLLLALAAVRVMLGGGADVKPVRDLAYTGRILSPWRGRQRRKKRG